MNEGNQTPRSFGQLLDRTFRLSKRHFKVFFLIILILTGPVYILDALIQLGSGVSFFRELGTGSNYFEEVINSIDSATELGLFANFLQILTSILMVILAPIAVAAILHGVKHINKGETFTPASLMKQAFTRFWPVVGSSLIVSMMFFGIVFVPIFMIIMLGVVGSFVEPVSSIIFSIILALGVLLGVALLGVRWGFYLGPVALEKDFPGLSRSWHLSKKRTWKLLGIFVILFLITNVIQSVFELILVAILGYSVLQFVLTSVITLFVNLILMVGYAVVFFDLKVRRDADDLDEMLSDYTQEPTPPRQ